MPRIFCTSMNAESGPHIELLRSAGFTLEIASRSINLFDSAALSSAITGYDAIIAGAEPYPRSIIEAHPALRVISRTGVGFDAIDLAACDDHQVVLATTPGVNHHSVAEHTIALLFSVARGIIEQDHRVREGRWKRIAHPRVMGRTIGIVGLGRIGRAVAWRAAGLGLNVAAYEPWPDREFVEQWRIQLMELDDLFARSDYVSLHLPMSPENRHLINDTSLARMKPGCVLINTARGQLVDEAAVRRSLESGHLRAAALDVFDAEPLPLDSPFVADIERTVLTGHVAGLDDESHADTFTMAAQTIIDLHRGNWPTFCIQNLKDVRDWSWNR